MGKRSTARRVAMQVLFQMDAGQTDLKQTLDLTLETDDFIEETKAFTQKLCEGAWQHIPEIDALITQYAKGWSLERIDSVDKAILRLAFYEMIYEKEVPNVAINEALDLAKKFCSPESPKFINGILGNWVKLSAREKIA